MWVPKGHGTVVVLVLLILFGKSQYVFCLFSLFVKLASHQGCLEHNTISMDDGTERMYYTGQGADGSTSIGVAKLSNENEKLTWVREQASFSLS